MHLLPDPHKHSETSLYTCHIVPNYHHCVCCTLHTSSLLSLYRLNLMNENQLDDCYPENPVPVLVLVLFHDYLLWSFFLFFFSPPPFVCFLSLTFSFLSHLPSVFSLILALPFSVHNLSDDLASPFLPSPCHLFFLLDTG